MKDKFKYTLITGACGGLGRAFSYELAKRGENLLLSGRSEEKLTELKRQIQLQYADVHIETFVCELTSEQARMELFAFVDRREITLNRLIYVAGADIQKSFEKYTQEKITFQTRVNFEGAISLAHGFLQRCQQDGKSELLAIGSVSALYPMPYFAIYSATKRALEQFYSALHVEMKGKIKVTCVQPGAMPTREDVQENIKTQGLWGKLAVKSPQDVVKISLRAVSKNRRAPIIGFWNNVMRAFTSLIPLKLKMKYIARRWSQTEKDAF